MGTGALPAGKAAGACLCPPIPSSRRGAFTARYRRTLLFMRLYSALHFKILISHFWQKIYKANTLVRQKSILKVKLNLRGSRFSWRCCSGFKSSGMLRCVVGWVLSEVSKSRVAFTYKEKYSNKFLDFLPLKTMASTASHSKSPKWWKLK